MRGGENSPLLRPIDHFGLVADTVDTRARRDSAGNLGVAGEKTMPPHAGDMPRGDPLSLYWAQFVPRKGDVRSIRAAIKSLGVCIADDATIGALFGMVRQVFRTRDAWWGKKEYPP